MDPGTWIVRPGGRLHPRAKLTDGPHKACQAGLASQEIQIAKALEGASDRKARILPLGFRVGQWVYWRVREKKCLRRRTRVSP